MSEPKFEEFLYVLSQKKFSINNVMENADTLQSVLYFLREDQVDVVAAYLYNKVSNRDERDSVNIILENIGKLYPMSKYLIGRILDSISDADHYLLNGVDCKAKFLMFLKRSFNDIKGNRRYASQSVNEYEKEIRFLEEERQKYSIEIEKVNDLIKKREILQIEVNKLKLESNPDEQKRQIKQLEDEKDKLLREKNINSRKKDELNKDIEKIMQELKSEKDIFGSRDSQKHLIALMKLLPSDAEE